MLASRRLQNAARARPGAAQAFACLRGAFPCELFLENFREDLTMKSRIFERATEMNVSRRTLLQGSAGIIGGSLLPAMPAFAEDKPAIGTYPAGVVRLLGLHRHFRAAHRHLRRAGRRRTQGLSARDRAHQQRP